MFTWTEADLASRMDINPGWTPISVLSSCICQLEFERPRRGRTRCRALLAGIHRVRATLRLTFPDVSSCSSVPVHEGTELPARGGNDWDVPLVVPAVDEDELAPRRVPQKREEQDEQDEAESCVRRVVSHALPRSIMCKTLVNPRFAR